MKRQNISAAPTKVQSTKNPKASDARGKRHPLDWLVFLFLVLTFVATAAAACYTRKQWITADDTEKRQVRAYAFATPTGVKDFEIGVAAERDARVPLRGKMGTGWDVAIAALFLASDEANFITGVALPVDGGALVKVG